MTALRKRVLEDMQIRNLAENTQESYVRQISLFARHFEKSTDALGPEEIRSYQVYLNNEKKLAPGSILIATCAPIRVVSSANDLIRRSQTPVGQSYHGDSAYRQVLTIRNLENSNSSALPETAK